MAKAAAYNPIWKDVVLPVILPIAVAVAGYINWQKTEQVHIVMNSRYTALEDKLAAALEKIDLLESSLRREDRKSVTEGDNQTR